MTDPTRRSGLEPLARERFRALGYVAPIDALSADEVACCAARMQEFLGREREGPDATLRHKPYLRFKWVSDLVAHPRVLDAVEALLGPDILAFRGTFFIKSAGDSSVVPWHQDLMQGQLDPEGTVSAWIALSDSGPENGCVRVVPASHLRGDLPHAPNPSPNRTLQLGQAITEPVRDEAAVDLRLRAGQMSLHHGRLVHGSCANPSPSPRVGLSVRYARPSAARAAGRTLTATLVRGEDRGGGFEHEPVPRCDDDPVALEWHARSMRGYAMGMIREIARNPSRRGIASLATMLCKPKNLRLAARLLRPRGAAVPNDGVAEANGGDGGRDDRTRVGFPPPPPSTPRRCSGISGCYRAAKTRWGGQAGGAADRWGGGMAAVASAIGLVLFLLASLVVGFRLLWLAGRTRGLPEALIGAAFVVGGVLGYIPEALVLDFGLVPEPARDAVLGLANAAIRASAVLTCMFTWRVFRPRDVWAGIAVGLIAAVLLAGLVAYPGPWVLAETPRDWGWSLITALMRTLAFAWAAAESLVQWRRALRRAALGLTGARVARRFLSWGVAIAGPAFMSAVPILIRVLPEAGSPGAWTVAQSLAGLVAAVAMGLTFFGPHRVRDVGGAAPGMAGRSH